MSTRRRLLGAGALVLALLAGTAETCQAQPTNADGRTFACDTRPSKPVLHRAGTRTTITASTRSSCDVPPVAHRAKVWIEYNAGQGWFQGYIPGQAHEEVCVDLPTRKGTTCTFTFRGCRIGQWRTRVLVTGTGPDGKRDFSFSPPRSRSPWLSRAQQAEEETMAVRRYMEYDSTQPIDWTPEQLAWWARDAARRRRIRIRRTVVAALGLAVALVVAIGALASRR